MEGHVHKKSGRWYVTLERSKDPETGARRRSSMGGYATRSEAREALRAALEQARRGWSGLERITLAAYLREWLGASRWSGKPRRQPCTRPSSGITSSLGSGARRSSGSHRQPSPGSTPSCWSQVVTAVVRSRRRAFGTSHHVPQGLVGCRRGPAPRLEPR